MTTSSSATTSVVLNLHKSMADIATDIQELKRDVSTWFRFQAV